MSEICVFAGTSEGRRLVWRLRGRGARLTACVATEYGAELLGTHADVRVRVGRLDLEAMKSMLREERFDAVVDATHPYADRATENIAAACGAEGVAYLRLERSGSADSSDGVFVQDAAGCAEYLKTTEGAVLLTTGSKDLAAFCADGALRGRLFARVLPNADSLKACLENGIPADRIFAMQGPFDEDMNCAMLRAAGAKYIVTKDSGSAGGYAAKIRAAEKCGVCPVILGRPPQREGQPFEAVAAELETRFHLAPAPKRVTLAGIGAGNPETQTAGLRQLLREADCLIGARRMLDAANAPGKREYEAFDAREIAAYVRDEKECRNFAVLFSGDPGFYSGAKKLLGELEGQPGITVEVLPGISSLAYFCARLKRSWENVRTVSLHGREEDLEGAVRGSEQVFVLAGGADGVKRALRRLTESGICGLTVTVGERLGYPQERIVRGSASELEALEFDPLSVLLVENPNAGKTAVTQGLPDDLFERTGVPMTKCEVRSVTLSKLALNRDSIVYDVGSGSGSVSVECARLADRGTVYAIDQNPEAADLTERNAEKFSLRNIRIIRGTAPEALKDLPAPTHAFIGGSCGRLRGILECLLEKNPSVRIVVNAVTLENLSEMAQIASMFEWSDIAGISVAKPRAVGSFHLMTAQNPVYVFALQNRRKGETGGRNP